MLAIATGSAQTLEQVREVIENVKSQKAPDKRQTVFDVTADAFADGTVYITGRISDKENLDALRSAVGRLGGKVDYHIDLLPDNVWAQVRIPVACMRGSGKYSSEMLTQTLMGMPVRVLEKDGGWWRIQSPDGYLGWVWQSTLEPKTPEELAQWRSADRLVVTSLYQVEAYDAPKAVSPRNIVTDLLPGTIVEGSLKTKKNGRVELTLPDGRKCWADAAAFTPIEKWADQPFDSEVILEQAYSLMGAPYMWGGTTAKMTDCSGLVKVSYLANGIILRRDASQQVLTGKRIDADDLDSLQAADLVFFSETPGGRVTHVGLYDKDHKFIHCAGRVHQSVMDKNDPSFAHRNYVGASRIAGNEGTTGIVRAIDHPWLFNLPADKRPF